ncbi:hypothetical protein RCH33_146 [Flavobacterium daejeonense]|nr:hypothetical protein RCH33_146 [Flavobacterium daejeonense]
MKVSLKTDSFFLAPIAVKILFLFILKGKDCNGKRDAVS